MATGSSGSLVGNAPKPFSAVEPVAEAPGVLPAPCVRVRRPAAALSARTSFASRAAPAFSTAGATLSAEMGGRRKWADSVNCGVVLTGVLAPDGTRDAES